MAKPADDEARLAVPLRDQAVKYLERQIDQIAFAKLPSDIRADLLAVLHMHRAVDCEYDGGQVICRVRPGFRDVIERAVAASKVL